MIDIVIALPDGQVHTAEVDSAATVHILRNAALAAVNMMSPALVGLLFCGRELEDDEALCDTGLSDGDAVDVFYRAPPSDVAQEVLSEMSGGRELACTEFFWSSALSADNRALMTILTCVSCPVVDVIKQLIARHETFVLEILQRYEFHLSEVIEFIQEAGKHGFIDDLEIIAALSVNGHNGLSFDWDEYRAVLCMSQGVECAVDVHFTGNSCDDIAVRPRAHASTLVHAQAVLVCLEHNITPNPSFLCPPFDTPSSLLEGAARMGRIEVMECLLEEGLLTCYDLAAPCCDEGNVFHLALQSKAFLQRLRAFHSYAWKWCGCVGDEEEHLVRALEQDDGRLSVVSSAVANLQNPCLCGRAPVHSVHEALKCTQLVVEWVLRKRPHHRYAALWRCGLVAYPEVVPCRIAYYDSWSYPDGDYEIFPPSIGDAPVREYISSVRTRKTRKLPNVAVYLQRRASRRKTKERAYLRSVKHM